MGCTPGEPVTWLGGAIPCKPDRVSILASYAYLRKAPDDVIARLAMHPKIELLLDSGAFTAFNSGSEINLPEYMAFLHKWESYLFGYMALDKLQDPIATDLHLGEMLADGLKPIPIHVYGDDQKRMEWLFARSPWVACGGLRRPHRGPAPDEYVRAKMEWANGRNVHWLGYTNADMIRAFRPYSVDCASFTSARIHGNASFYLGRGDMVVATEGKWKSRAKASGATHKMLRDAVAAVGMDPAILDQPSSWKTRNYAHVACDISLRSWIRYSIDVRKTFGTRVYLAGVSAVAVPDIHTLIRGVDWAATEGLV